MSGIIVALFDLLGHALHLLSLFACLTCLVMFGHCCAFDVCVVYFCHAWVFAVFCFSFMFCACLRHR